MAVDPAIQIRREAAQLRVAQAGVTPRAIQASLKKTTREPKGIEVGYQAFLVSIQKQINALIRKQLPELFAILDRVRVDSVRSDGVSDDVLASFETLRGFVNNLAVKTDGVLRVGVQDFGIKTAQFNDAKYDDPLMNLLGIGDVSASIEQSILEGWVTENTQLIRNMNVEQLGKLETLFLRSLRDGSRSAQVTGDVSAILGGSVERARLIARDQIGKLDGQLSQQKQTEAGIDGYAWRGALDGRERPSHVAREGLIFKWNAPPPDGHPGQPVQCRCQPEPDLSHLGEEFAPDPPGDADLSDTTPEARKKSRNQQAKNRRAKERTKQRKEAASLKAAKKRTPGPPAKPPTPTPAPTPPPEPAPAPAPAPQPPIPSNASPREAERMREGWQRAVDAKAADQTDPEFLRAVDVPRLSTPAVTRMAGTAGKALANADVRGARLAVREVMKGQLGMQAQYTNATVKGELIPQNAGIVRASHHEATHKIVMQTEDAATAGKALADVAKGARVADEQVDVARLLFHEEIHAHARVGPGWRASSSIFVEEVSTEVLARRMSRDVFNLNLAADQKLTGVRRGLNKRGNPVPVLSNDGSYGLEIEDTARIIQKHTGRSTLQVMEDMEGAAWRMRTDAVKPAKLPSEHVRNFVDGLPATPEQRTSIWADLREKELE